MCSTARPCWAGPEAAERGGSSFTREQERPAALAGIHEIDFGEPGPQQALPFGPAAVVALEDDLVETTKESHESRLVLHPVQDAERDHDVRPKRLELIFPLPVAIEVDLPELRLHAECLGDPGSRRENCRVAVDRERGRGTGVLEQKGRQ